MQRIVAKITVSHVEKQTERHVCPNRTEMRNKMSDAIKYLWANQAQGTLEQVYVHHHELDGDIARGIQKAIIDDEVNACRLLCGDGLQFEDQPKLPPKPGKTRVIESRNGGILHWPQMWVTEFNFQENPA